MLYPAELQALWPNRETNAHLSPEVLQANGARCMRYVGDVKLVLRAGDGLPRGANLHERGD